MLWQTLGSNTALLNNDDTLDPSAENLKKRETRDGSYSADLSKKNR